MKNMFLSKLTHFKWSWEGEAHTILGRIHYILNYDLNHKNMSDKKYEQWQ